MNLSIEFINLFAHLFVHLFIHQLGQINQWPQLQGIQPIYSQASMAQGMNVYKVQSGQGGKRQVVQVPREGLHNASSRMYSTVDNKSMADIAITYSTTSIQGL